MINNTIHHIYFGTDLSRYLEQVQHQIDFTPGYSHHLWLFPISFQFSEAGSPSILVSNETPEIFDFCKRNHVSVNMEYFSSRLGDKLKTLDCQDLVCSDISQDFLDYGTEHNIEYLVTKSLELIKHLHLVGIPSGAKDILMPLIILMHGGVCMDLNVRLTQPLPTDMVAPYGVLFNTYTLSEKQALDLDVFAGASESHAIFACLYLNLIFAESLVSTPLKRPSVDAVYQGLCSGQHADFVNRMDEESYKDAIRRQLELMDDVNGKLMSVINSIDLPYFMRAVVLNLFSGGQNPYCVLPDTALSIASSGTSTPDIRLAPEACMPGIFVAGDSMSRAASEKIDQARLISFEEIIKLCAQTYITIIALQGMPKAAALYQTYSETLTAAPEPTGLEEWSTRHSTSSDGARLLDSSDKPDVEGGVLAETMNEEAKKADLDCDPGRPASIPAKYQNLYKNVGILQKHAIATNDAKAKAVAESLVTCLNKYSNLEVTDSSRFYNEFHTLLHKEDAHFSEHKHPWFDKCRDTLLRLLSCFLPQSSHKHSASVFFGKTTRETLVLEMEENLEKPQTVASLS